MRARACTAALMLLLWQLTGGSAASWTPSLFPDPGKNLAACGRAGVVTEHSRVCDPDSVLSSGSRDVVEGIIQDIEAFRHPYAAMQCDGRTTGYKVGVAVMDRMKMAPAADPATVARDFAKTLHDRWGVGDRACNNGVLLLLAVQDRQVYVSTGVGVLTALPDSSVQAILEKMRPTLRRSDYDDAVEQAVVDIGLVLAGQGPKPDNSGTWIFAGIVSSLAAVFGWGIYKSRQQRREYLTCRALLEKLKREQETALRTRQFHSASCPICMEEFAPDGAPAPAGPSDPTTTTAAGKPPRKPSKDSDPRRGGGDWEVVEPSAPLLPKHLRGDAGAGPSSGAAAASTAARPAGAASGGGGGRRALVLPCGHRFCHDCITQWVETASNSTCPVCRKSIREEDGSDDTAQPLPSAPRHQYDPYNDMFVPEAQFRLARLHARYPYYVDSGMVDTWGNAIQQGHVVNMETLRQSQMASEARSSHGASGSMGASTSFGGGSSFGGGGGGSSW